MSLKQKNLEVLEKLESKTDKILLILTRREKKKKHMFNHLLLISYL